MSDKKNPAEVLWNRLHCDPIDLVKKISLAEAEASHMITIRGSGEELPFGYNHGQWRRLLANMQEGDELWEFNSDEDSWEMMAGVAGIALLRDGKIIDEIVTQMN